MTREDYDGTKRPTKVELERWRKYATTRFGWISEADGPGKPPTMIRLLDYIAALERVAEAARSISKWEFAADGRKFAGDHKEVVREITGIATRALAALDADAKEKP